MPSRRSLVQRVYPAAIDLLPDRQDLDARLAAFAATARTDEAAAARARQHWLEQAALEDATFAGALVDLAERGVPVVVRCGDRRHTGAIEVVGADHLELRAPPARTFISFGAITGVLAAGSGARARRSAARTFEGTATFADALRGLAEERPPVVIEAAGGTLSGELTAVGRDVAWVDGAAVPMGSIAWVLAR